MVGQNSTIVPSAVATFTWKKNAVAPTVKKVRGCGQEYSETILKLSVVLRV